jgi:hypothetical protein
VRQRIYGLCQGYEDLNDHDTLRHNLAWQTAVERDKPLASSPTLCRLENRANRQVAWAVHQVLVDQFIASFPQAPGELILDFDATDAHRHDSALQSRMRMFRGLAVKHPPPHQRASVDHHRYDGHHSGAR